MIRQHYDVLEAMALDKEAGETEDQTKPNLEEMTKRAGETLAAFSEAVFPDGYNQGTKRRGVMHLFSREKGGFHRKFWDCKIDCCLNVFMKTSCFLN